MLCAGPTVRRHPPTSKPFTPCPQTNPKLHDTIMERLMDTFPSIRTSRVAACALWILSEYCLSKEEIAAALEVG